MSHPASPPLPRRSDLRRFAALIIITAATSIAFGVTLRQPTQMGANDISRWCTIWSLLERGSFIIDECPWQLDTQDKIFKAVKSTTAEPGSPPVKHYYSSKPALLPTMIAGILYPARKLSGVPLDYVFLQTRAPRWTQKPDPDSPGKIIGVLETPKDPVKWPAYIFYFKPILILLNVLPFCLYLVHFTRLLDEYAANDWSWLFALVGAAFGTYLLPFSQTLNNHTVAAYSTFFAIEQFIRIWEQGKLAGWRFALAGFFASFAATNELPALAFLAMVFSLLLVRDFKRTMLFFVPGAIIPIVALAGAQYAAFGEFSLAYEAFGSDEYLYEGSLWKTPLDLDALNETPEPYGIYFFHLTLGHHGFFSLTPIFVFGALGAMRLLQGGGRAVVIGRSLTLIAAAALTLFLLSDQSAWMEGGAYYSYRAVLLVIPVLLALLAIERAAALWRGQGEPLSALALITVVLTVVLLAFYGYTPKARNYGGMTAGLRWLFWLIPLWVPLIPKGVESGQDRPWARGLMLLALALSVISVGYTMRNPWSHPWLLDAIEHLGFYDIKR
jgi:hypothetical protein